MKLEQSEFFLIEEFFKKTQEKGVLDKVNLIEVDKLTGDASTRRYYRLYTSEGSQVVCLDNPFEGSAENHPFLSVQNFLFENHIHVPRVLDHNLARGYILQEDLGNETLITYLSKISSKQEELEVYKTIIDQLIELHKIQKKNVYNPHLFNLQFDFQKLMDETRFTFKYFMNFFQKNQDQHLIAELDEMFSPIMQRLAAEKMVITHRDFHSRNIMVKDGRFVFIDFQDARWGIPQYDLVSLLEDCYYEVRPENKQFLKNYYFEKLGSDIHGQSSFDEFQSLYSDMTIQRVFKAVGSFCYIYNWRKV